MELNRLLRANIAALCPYSTARDECSSNPEVFLDANESPYDNGWNRYPDPHQKALKARISEIKGLPVENIFLGNGSDEAIDLVFRVFCEPGRDNVVAISPSYGMYAVAAQTNDVAVKEVMLRDDFSLDADAVLKAVDERTKAIFLCSPNNPSGNAFPRGELLRIASEADCIVIVDEAYIDFSSEESLLGCIGEYPNIIVLQTMSKARGMAALRLGLAFADERIIAYMSRVKYPYNINEATQRIALELLSQPVDAQLAEIISERAKLSVALGAFACVEKVYPSDANFLLVKVDDADALYSHLLADGVIVRNRNRVPLCKGCLRITVGLPEENERVIKSMYAYEKGDIHR